MYKKTIHKKRTVSSALIGAVFGTLFDILLLYMDFMPVQKGILFFIHKMISFFICGIMVWILFPGKINWLFCKKIAGWYLISLLTAGCFMYMDDIKIKYQISEYLTWGLIVLMSVFLIRYIIMNGKSGIFKVVLYLGEEEIHVNGLLDTGNLLTDPLSGKPVSIIEEKVLQQVKMYHLEKLSPRIIPYRSIGKKDGVMMGLVFPKMIISDGRQEYVIDQPIIALCKTSISEQNRYQMILHGSLWQE